MKRFAIDFLTGYDDETLLDELRRIARVTGSNTVTRAQINEVGRVTILRWLDDLVRCVELVSLPASRVVAS